MDGYFPATLVYSQEYNRARYVSEATNIPQVKNKETGT